MSKYNGMVLTKQGLQLETKAQTGTPLKFTKVTLGDGSLVENQILQDLTSLINAKLELPILSVNVTGTGTAKMQTALQNKDLQVGFFAREIGVFATDPDLGEILYAYSNAGDTADYIPAGGGADVVELILEIITVIGQAANVTANINSSLVFATQTDLDDHKNSTNPHPNFLKLGSAVTDFNKVIVQQNDDKTVNPIDFASFRKKILGGEGADITFLNGRLAEVEREQANIALALETQKIYPDYNCMIAEDFVNPDMVDTFVCNVTSVAAGDNSIDVSSLTNILLGSWYTITDGINQEYVQVKSCIKNGSVLRLILNQNIECTYLIAQTILLRSTAQIGIGVVYGSGDKKGFLWNPSTVWGGVNSNVSTTILLETTQSNANLFTSSGDVAYTTDGFFTLAV